MARQLPSEIEISTIKITKPGGDSELEIIPAPVEDGVTQELFINLSLKESIYDTGITGLLKIKEPSMVGDYFNFVGNEQVQISFRSPEPIDESYDLTLCVSNVKYLGDETEDALSGPSARAGAGWAFELVACESYLLDSGTLDYMDSDYIGKISDLIEENIAEKYLNPGITPFSFSENEMEIEETHNSIWLKKNHIMYPWGKDVHPPNLLSLMNNLAENAVTTDGPGHGVNFLFWQDFDGWHFKSIRKMIQDSDTSWGFGLFGSTPRTYIVSDSDIPEDQWTDGDPRIQSFRILSEYDHISCLQNGAYSSYYELVKPNYDNPYFDYIDFTTKHSSPGGQWGEREIVTYDYHRDSETWGDSDEGGRVEKEKLLPKTFYTSINIENPNNITPKSVRMYDESNLYGYFSDPYNSSSGLEYDYFGSLQTEGKYGKTNNILWQTMFDQTDLNGLDGEINIKTIQENIKKPLQERYKEYVAIKNLKESFNVYKRSVCCDKTAVVKNTFFAVIDDAIKVQDNGRSGIYEYSWREVELWPKDNIDEYEGEIITPEDAPITVVAIENGLSGIASLEGERKDPAYNVNELMNVDDGDDVFAGPGVNLADEDFNDYPEAFQVMPVGGYFKVGDDPCEEQEEGETGVYFHKHIVQMYRIPNYVLESVVPTEPNEEDPDDETPTEIYLFDVVNAHDGLCSCP